MPQKDAFAHALEVLQTAEPSSVVKQVYELFSAVGTLGGSRTEEALYAVRFLKAGTTDPKLKDQFEVLEELLYKRHQFFVEYD